jgi:hypothetical protein
MKAVTADQFAAQLRAGGCHGTIDRSISGVTYVRIENVQGDPTWGIYAIFEGDRFRRARDVRLGVSRRHWRTYRSMAAIRRTLGIKETN